MLFHTYAFVFAFLPLTLLGFFGLAKWRGPTYALAWLFAASCVFYAAWNPFYLPLLLASVAANHLIGRRIAAQLGQPSARRWLTLGVAGNLLLLGVFKYLGLFTGWLEALTAVGWPSFTLLLPLGLSFYCFTQIAYLVDTSRGETPPDTGLSYAAFVTFFPHLIAGPILRHGETVPQLLDPRTYVPSRSHMAWGLGLFALGLAKKVLVADRLAPWVAPVFDNAAQAGFVEAWGGALAYTFQLYFDFSGYSDMALGLAALLNIRLPWNFNSPYQATSLIAFWRRWHMTLSHFLKHYLYIPLGGNRRGPARRQLNLLLTMGLGGLWHGAGATFLVWGLYHGLGLSLNHGAHALGWRAPKLVGWALTFTAVVVGWVIFRAPDLAAAGQLLVAMTGLSGTAPTGLFPAAPRRALVLGALLLVVTLGPNSQTLMARLRPSAWLGLLAGGVVVGALLSANEVSEFLYYQF